MATMRVRAKLWRVSFETSEFQPIILHERANEGRTVIEKVEAHGVVGFAVVLLTPDDEGCEKVDTRTSARQNVVLELVISSAGSAAIECARRSAAILRFHRTLVALCMSPLTWREPGTETRPRA